MMKFVKSLVVALLPSLLTALALVLFFEGIRFFFEVHYNIPGSTDITLHESDVRHDCDVHEFGGASKDPVLYFACSGTDFGYALQRYCSNHTELRVTSMAPFTVWYGAQTTGYYVTFEKKNRWSL